MVIYKDSTRLHLSCPWWHWIMMVLTLLALVLSSIMSWHYLVGGSMAGCGGGSPCEQVLNSRWSMVAGILPVSGLAMGVYLAMLVASFFVGQTTEVPIRRLAWRVMLILTGILVVTQVVFSPSAVYSEGESQDNLPALDLRSVPVIGSPDAPYVVTLLFDYQCSHCQKIHFMLDETVRRYDDKLAFMLCPAPLNTQCNPYIPRDADEFKNSCELTKIGLAVWVAKREAFPAFENWMFTFESGDRWLPRNLETARVKAVELVGQEKFDVAWCDPWIGRYMETCIQIYGQTIKSGMGGIPKLIFGSRWVIPEPHNADDLVMILQNRLAVPKP
jgi:uncharacterized membrane protein